jgi:AraC-like DNA-binding protein
MIKSREKLKNRLIKTNGFFSGKKAIELFPEKPALQSTEQKFINRLMILIEENISSTAFDVQTLSLEIGMEASVLHRKLKAVINQSPGDFIRSMRMKRAAQLLEDKNLSISEVASMVGFENNISYFSTVFRKYSGKTPKEYQNSL